MKQILQDLSHGKTSIIEAPSPQNSAGQVLIHTSVSLISAGTERMLVDFGKASYLDKARQQPEKVKMVLEKIKTDGLFSTVSAVRSKLSQPLPLGYCNVGVVAEVGFGVKGLAIGDRVVSNAPHGDVVNASGNLCARIPDNVSDEAASFTVLASIALQGIRLATPTLGETVAVIGVGLIGLLTVQILKAYGCKVLALDYNEDNLNLAHKFGASICNLAADEDPIAAGMNFSRGRGVDAVIITASTKSNDPVSNAAKMSRKRGRIVLVGVTGLELNRADFYEKELTFQVSCSYGPGRYDAEYEKACNDYPVGFVRWTAQRNFEACLDLLANNQLQVDALITHRYLFENAPEAYQTLVNEPKVLGVILQYKSETSTRQNTQISFDNQVTYDPMKPMLGFIGAGNYASRVLIPAFKKAGAQFHTIVTSGGLNSVIHGRKAGFLKASTDVDAMLHENLINAVVVATRHDTHAHFVAKSLNAGKHVFVEKPIALNLDQLSSIEAAYHTAIMTGKKPCLMVGFNRRFAPQVQKMKKLLQSVIEPQSFIMTINAGQIPLDHWTQDQMVGGGRIIGEACHFIDLMRYLAGSEIAAVNACSMNDAFAPIDKATITLSFVNGSFGSIHYLANGASSFPKERIEVFAGGRVLQLDNFRRLYGFGWPKFKKMMLWRQNKGQQECAAAFLNSIESGEPAPISAAEIFEVARVSIRVDELLRQPVNAEVK